MDKEAPTGFQGATLQPMDTQTREQLIAGVQERLVAGVSKENITSELLAAGYSSDDVAMLFTSLSETRQEPTETTPDEISKRLEPSDTRPLQEPSKKPRRWLWWVLGVLGFMLIGFVALLIINPPLPAGSDALKHRALNELRERGEFFRTSNNGNFGGLCAFMSLNESYREVMNDPTWEFTCLDSTEAFAGEVRLNNGTYRCIDSLGNDIRSANSIIQKVGCAEEALSSLSQSNEIAIDAHSHETSMSTSSPTTREGTMRQPISTTTSPDSMQTGGEADEMRTMTSSPTDCGVYEIPGGEEYTRRKKLEIKDRAMVCLSQAVAQNCTAATLSIKERSVMHTYSVEQINDVCMVRMTEPVAVQCDAAALYSYHRYKGEQEFSLTEWVARFSEGPRTTDQLFQEFHSAVDWMNGALRLMSNEKEKTDHISKYGCTFLN